MDPSTGKVTGHGTGKLEEALSHRSAVHEIVLAGPQEKTAVTSGTCELDRTVATVVTDRDTTEIRVLAQRNVVLIRSARPLSLAGAAFARRAAQLPP